MYQQLVISLFTEWTLNLSNFLAPRPFMAFDITPQNVETESSMQVAQEQSDFFNNLSV